MTRVKYTEKNQNRRRSQRSLSSSSRKVTNKRNENEVVTIDSEDEQPEIKMVQSDSVGVPTRSPVFNRLLGDVGRDFIPLRQNQIQDTHDKTEYQEEFDDVVGTQIVPYGYCFEEVNDCVDDNVATNVDADDNVAPKDNEDDDNVKEVHEDVIYEKAVNEDTIVITIDEGGDDESEEDEIVLSTRINRPREAKGKRKQTDEYSKENKIKKSKIDKGTLDSKRVTRQSSAANKQNTIKRNRKSHKVGMRKLEQKNDGRKKTAKVERYSRGLVLGINREELYEDAPLLLPREKWSNIQKLSIYARYEVLKNIKDKLSRKHLARFTESCFGKFLDIKISKFPSQLLYHMLRRQCTPTKRDELWFNFEGRVVKFCMKDFEKITGLNCGELPEMNLQNLRGRFLNKYFEVEKPIKRTIVNDLFMSMEGVKKKDKVKLAKLYFLSNFLLGKQVGTGVEIDHITLLDDEEQFDIYPWGRLAYTITIDSIKKSIKNPDASVLGIAGFPYALLVWAYECIPILSGPTMLCAQKVSSGMPKMINWVAAIHPEWKDLGIKVFENENFEFYEMVDENEDVLPGEENKQVEEQHHFHGETSHIKQENNHGANIPSAPEEFLVEFKAMVMNSLKQLNNKMEFLFDEVENMKHILKKEEGNVDGGNDCKDGGGMTMKLEGMSMEGGYRR